MRRSTSIRRDFIFSFFVFLLLINALHCCEVVLYTYLKSGVVIARIRCNSMDDVEGDRIISDESESDDDFGPQPSNDTAAPDAQERQESMTGDRGSGIDDYATTNKIPISHQVDTMLL